jgi:hypothetical protein
MIPGGTGFNEFYERIKTYADFEIGEDKIAFAFND